MIDMVFLRKNRDFDKGRSVRVISVSAINMGGKKTQAYVNFEYDMTAYDLETSGTSVIVSTFIKKHAEHASFFFPNELLRKVEVIMEARDEVEIEKMIDMISDENVTWLDLKEKHKGSIKGKKFGI